MTLLKMKTGGGFKKLKTNIQLFGSDFVMVNDVVMASASIKCHKLRGFRIAETEGREREVNKVASSSDLVLCYLLKRLRSRTSKSTCCPHKCV